MELHTIGIDLARQFFIWLDSTARRGCVRKKCRKHAALHGESARST